MYNQVPYIFMHIRIRERVLKSCIQVGEFHEFGKSTTFPQKSGNAKRLLQRMDSTRMNHTWWITNINIEDTDLEEETVLLRDGYMHSPTRQDQDVTIQLLATDSLDALKPVQSECDDELQFEELWDPNVNANLQAAEINHTISTVPLTRSVMASEVLGDHTGQYQV